MTRVSSLREKNIASKQIDGSEPWTVAQLLRPVAAAFLSGPTPTPHPDQRGPLGWANTQQFAVH